MSIKQSHVLIIRSSHSINHVYIILCSISSEKEDEEEDHEEIDAVTGHKKPNKLMKNIKIAVLFVVWLVFTGFLMTNSEKELTTRQVAVAANNGRIFRVMDEVIPKPRFALILEGAFMTDHDRSNHTNLGNLFVYVQLVNEGEGAPRVNRAVGAAEPGGLTQNITQLWKLRVDPDALDRAPEITRRKVFQIDQITLNKIQNGFGSLQVYFESDFNVSFPMRFTFDPTPIDTDLGLILASIVLLGLYVMIIWEVVSYSRINRAPNGMSDVIVNTTGSSYVCGDHRIHLGHRNISLYE